MAQKESAAPKKESGQKKKGARDHREFFVKSCIVLAVLTVVVLPHAKRTSGSEKSTDIVRSVELLIESEEEDTIDLLMSLSMAEPFGQCRAATPKPLGFSCHKNQN
ncbi:hypothetical protein NW762_011071 [Fusarium torreyae]|uniref:Uncharacterized protein n=1 Tax=Fusarium torreyae TaxID=1237075 RepID=A0A9W8V9T9_9HYPO|nr:hypothetical protein NW762_011071 [Fusarium torreyae]